MGRSLDQGLDGWVVMSVSDVVLDYLYRCQVQVSMYCA